MPPNTPSLAIELDGITVTADAMASVGQNLKLICRSQGGNPSPHLSFLINGETVEADNKEMMMHGEYDAVHSFKVEDHHSSLDVSCIAESKLTPIPLASNHQSIQVQCKSGSLFCDINL